jgi:hypothetical protein
MRHAVLLATLRVERFEDDGKKGSADWKRSAIEATSAQRQLEAAEARLKLHQAQSAQAAASIKADEAAKAVESAEQNTDQALTEKERADKIVARKKTSEKAVKDLEAQTKKIAKLKRHLRRREGTCGRADDRPISLGPSRNFPPSARDVDWRSRDGSPT